MICFHDGSFGNMPGDGSQGGQIVGVIPKDTVTQEGFYQLGDQMVDFVPLIWRSGRMQRVARSTFCAETLSMSDALDQGQYMRELVSELYRKEFTIVHVTDCKSLKDNIDSIVPHTSEKRLRRDLNAMREAIWRTEVSKFLWADTFHQLADGLTKNMEVSGLLEAVQVSAIRMGQNPKTVKIKAKRKQNQSARVSRREWKANWIDDIAYQSRYSRRDVVSLD